MTVIDVKNLVKTFPQPGQSVPLKAVDGVSFSVQAGEIFGLLGPNGAGKTTTLEIIESLQSPTSGQVTVLGMDIQKDSHAIKQRIGVQLQSSSYFDDLKLTEILKLFGTFYHKQTSADELLDIVELKEKRNSLIKQLSGGQQQRFSIAASLVNDPELVFLDEPTTGLDPQARRHMWDFIRRIKQQGKTVVLTTHYMEEAQELCHRVGIMDHGRIVALDTPEKLINNLEATARLTFTLDTVVDPTELASLPGVLASTHDGHNYQLRISHVSEAMPPLIRWAGEKQLHLRNIEITRATLEDVFIHLTGSKLRE